MNEPIAQQPAPHPAAINEPIARQPAPHLAASQLNSVLPKNFKKVLGPPHEAQQGPSTNQNPLQVNPELPTSLLQPCCSTQSHEQ